MQYGCAGGTNSSLRRRVDIDQCGVPLAGIMENVEGVTRDALTCRLAQRCTTKLQPQTEKWLHRCPRDRQDRHTLLYEDDDKALLYMKEGCDGLMVDTGVSFACGKSGAPRRVGRLYRKGRSPPRARHARQTIDELIRQVRDPAAAAARGNDRQRIRRRPDEDMGRTSYPSNCKVCVKSSGNRRSHSLRVSSYVTGLSAAMRGCY